MSNIWEHTLTEIYLTALQVKMRMIQKSHLLLQNNIEDDNQHIAQYSETSDDGDSSSYGLEDTRTTSNMGCNRNLPKVEFLSLVVAKSATKCD